MHEMSEVSAVGPFQLLIMLLWPLVPLYLWSRRKFGDRDYDARRK